MNEAELQTNLRQRIQQALPTLPAEFTLEHYLHLRLGHSEILLNGLHSDKTAVKGRYDLLVKIAGEPLVLVELKAPGVAITETDIHQGLSYARLHMPPVPLLLATNGHDTQLRGTYDGKTLDPANPFAAHLQERLAAAALAATQMEDAIRVLLGASHVPWQQMLAAWSAEQAEPLTGEVTDLSAPLAQGFSIQRNVVGQMEQGLQQGQRLLVLHGPPLSGITNALVQLSRSQPLKPVLFVDVRSTPDILQYVANKLSWELSFPVIKDDVRGWLNKKQSLAELVIVLDGWPAADAMELLHSALQGSFQLVIGLTTKEYQEAAVEKGRPQKTLLGRKAETYELQPLTDAEFRVAQQVLLESCRVFFLPGARHNPELRFPRSLRVHAAVRAHAGATTPPESPETDEYQLAMALNPITGVRELLSLTTLFQVQPEIERLLQKLAEVYLRELITRRHEPEWLAATYGFPSLGVEDARAVLQRSEVDELLQAGYLVWFKVPGLGSRLLIRFEEILTYSVGAEWARQLELLHTKTEIEQAIAERLELLWIIPRGEVALALALELAGRSGSPLLDVALSYLLAREPTTTRLGEGRVVRLLTTDAPVTLHFGENMDEVAYDNVLPWVVLSHLAARPMARGTDTLSYNVQLFTTIGNSPVTLYAPHPTRLAETTNFHYHEVREGVNLLCWENGLVEPIVQSLVEHLRRFSHEFAALAERSIAQDEPFLGWRLLTAAHVLTSNANEEIQQAATSAYEQLRTWLRTTQFHPTASP